MALFIEGEYKKQSIFYTDKGNTKSISNLNEFHWGKRGGAWGSRRERQKFLFQIAK
jgi:hypothetical protein